MPEIPQPEIGGLKPTKWRVDSVMPPRSDSTIRVKLPDPGGTLTVHNDGEHFWVTNEVEGSAYRAGREEGRRGG